MNGQTSSAAGEEWLHGKFSEVIERLERDRYAALEEMSDAQYLTLLMRLHKNRADHLTFLLFLDRFEAWRRSNCSEMEHHRFDRIVMLMPMLRRDAMTLLPGGCASL